MESGDIIAFLHDIYQDLWGMAAQKHLNYNFMTFAKSFTVAFDPQAVETIVYNLLSNAVKYTPEKGDVTLTIRQETATRQLVITVEDNGPGLSAEQQERVFHPYMSGYISHNGMGIGLYTAYNMARVHHGTLIYQRATAGVAHASSSPSPTTTKATVPKSINKNRNTTTTVKTTARVSRSSTTWPPTPSTISSWPSSRTRRTCRNRSKPRWANISAP